MLLALFLGSCHPIQNPEHYDVQRASLLLDSAYRIQESAPSNAVKLANQALSLAEQHNDQKIIQRALVRLATAYEIRSNLDSALQCWQHVLANIKSPNDSLAGAAWMNMGILNLRLKNYPLAAANLHQARAIKEVQHHLPAIAKVNQNLSAVYFEWGKLDSAIFFIEKTLQMAKANRDTIAIGDALTAIGGIYNDQGKLNLAYGYLTQAKTLLAKYSAPNESLYVLLNLGAWFEKQGKLDSALAYYQRVDSMSRAVNNIDILIRSFRNRSYLYAKKKNFEDAFRNLDLAVYTEDSLNKLTYGKQFAELQAKYKDLEDQSKIAKLQSKASQDDLIQKSLFIFICLIALLAALVTWNFISNIRLSKEKIQKLEEEKEVHSLQSMLFAQEEERKRISRDLHDSIGSLISSAKLYLSNAEEQISKVQELDIVHSAESILERASLEIRRVAHDMMPGILTKLGLIEGIESFFDSIRSANKMVVSFTHDPYEERFSEPSEIMLYRIVQELVNNSIKHSQAGEIKLMVQINEDVTLFDYRDDGIGFDVALHKDLIHYGLNSIGSRIRFLEGTYTIQSEEGEGVHYRIEFNTSKLCVKSKS